MHLLLLIPLTISLILGCASKTKDLLPPTNELLPPEYRVNTDKNPRSLASYLTNIENTTSLSGIKWWSQYRRAQLWKKDDPATSCSLFSQLASNTLFPLSRVALLRARQVCPADHPQLTQVTVEPSEKDEPWLKDLLVEINLDYALKTNDDEASMKFLIQKSKNSIVRSEKVSLTQKALDIALRLNDQEKVKSYNRRLFKLAPRLIKKPKRRDYLKVAYDFRRVRDFNSARMYYTKVLRSKRFGAANKITALKGIRASYKLERDMDTYMTATEDLAKFVSKYYQSHKKTSSSIRQFYKTHISLARTYWTLGHDSSALRILKMLPKKLKGRHSMAEVFWLRGRMLEERQKFSKSVQWFELASKELIANDEFKEKILWYLSWNQKKLKNYNKSIEILTKLRNETTNPFGQSKFGFWLAKTMQLADQKESADLEFQKLIDDDPIGYYGLLAHRELNRPIQHPAHRRQPASEAPPTKDVSVPNELVNLLNPVYIKWLISVEENVIARNYLDHISNAYRKKNNQSRHAWLSLFNFYAQAGEYLNLFVQLGKLDPEQRKSILQVQPEIIFPTPFREHVIGAAQSHKISEEFIYAIMRQESAFNKYARSHADAFGLMQILPEVAQKTAGKTDVAFTTAEDLFDPKTNIHIGAAFLKELSDKYDSRFILTVASYNATDTAIRNWLRTRYRGDTLEFIEDVPYEETQAYIKLVMRNLIFYQILNSKGKPVEFPNWVLDIGSPDA